MYPAWIVKKRLPKDKEDEMDHYNENKNYG